MSEWYLYRCCVPGVFARLGCRQEEKASILPIRRVRNQGDAVRRGRGLVSAGTRRSAQLFNHLFFGSESPEALCYGLFLRTFFMASAFMH